MYACGRMCVYTPVHDHLEIVYIKVLVFCRDDSSVENWMHQYACMQYANESHSKSQSIVFRLKFTRKNKSKRKSLQYALRNTLFLNILTVLA